MLQTRSSILLVAQVNTQAGGSAVVITNSQNLGVNVQNSAGWIVYVANTVAGGDAVTITNSAGWIMAQSNTVSNISIINSAGWIFAQSNTSPLVSVQNSAGWVVAQSNTNGMAVTFDTNKIYDGLTSATTKYRNINVTGSGNTLLANAVSGKRIRILSMFLMSNSNSTVYIQNDSTSATNLIGPLFLSANVGFVLPLNQYGWQQTGTSTLLNLSSSTINSMGGCLTYIECS